MAGMMASAASGVMGSVIGKLAAMLGEKYQLAQGVEDGIRFLKDELTTMDAVLQMLADKDDDQIDPLSKDWRSKVRELSYDIEDCIDRFVLNHSSNGGSSKKANFVRKAMRKVRTLLQDGGIAKEIQELKSLVSEQSERAKRYHDNLCLVTSIQPVLLDSRAPALFQEARDLVGIDGPCEEVIQILKCEEKQHRVVSIYGTGGQGKTTLAMEVYHKTTESFDCRAFVSVSQTPDMKKLLRDILFQIISKSEFDKLQPLETDEQLIRTLRECLKDKRYFILIDDIWEVRAWELVRSALPLNDKGSRIITTTRIRAVANSCCTGIAAQMYEAQPLSDEDSQRLFFKRLFWSNEDCPQYLRKVSNDILRKCCGLPLAIISMAGLLANKSKTVDAWVDTLKSISATVEKDSPIDKMKRILLLSFFDLPHHLKSCLLYLSVFPEDYLIDCRKLILLWVAEGLIPGQDRERMEQLGRSYLNELINRSLVQPTKVGADGATVKHCRVHDVILEFIVSKAVQENFVTIWNGNGFSENYSSNKVRRLSIQKNVSGRAAVEMARTIKNAAHIRSINIFGSNSVLLNKHESEFLSSQILRVLNVEGGTDEVCSLGHVKSFGQLKYLSIDNFFCDCKLPDDIEKLQHIETLDVRRATILHGKLPTSNIHLQKLVRLFVDRSMQLPDGIQKLQALEQLSEVNVDNQSVQFIQGLGDLTNLRVLDIYWLYPTEDDTEGQQKAYISSLSKLLVSLRELRMGGSGTEYTAGMHSLMASCVPTETTPPPPLQRLVLLDAFNFNSLGPQLSSLVNPTRLYIRVYGDVGKEGINILASLPMLLSLTFALYRDEARDSATLYPRDTIKRPGFQLLTKLYLYCAREAALEFEMGAMPKLQRLKLRLLARCQFKYGEGGLVLGLQNLVDLKHVAVDIGCEHAVADEVEASEHDIRDAAGAHPNRPILQFRRYNEEIMA